MQNKSAQTADDMIYAEFSSGKCADIAKKQKTHQKQKENIFQCRDKPVMPYQTAQKPEEIKQNTGRNSQHNSTAKQK